MAHCGLSDACFDAPMTELAGSHEDVLDHVVCTLRRVAAPYERKVNEATELYYDLGLAGDDLYDAIDAIRQLSGADFSRMDLRLYAPNEVSHNFGLNFLRAFREWRGERTYRSLTVGRLVAAVQAGAWEDR